MCEQERGKSDVGMHAFSFGLFKHKVSFLKAYTWFSGYLSTAA